ncbi:MAG: hypothetical protein ABGX27_05820 [Desulfurobacteriaceae bacterium]
MDFEKEKVFEEKFPALYNLLSSIAFGMEEGRSEWDIVRKEIKSFDDAEKVLNELEEFLKNRPSDFEHVIEDVANVYFDDTNEFLRWMEQLKRYILSVKSSLK